MLLGKTESGTYRLARGEELAAILVQSESTEETHSFPLRLCDPLFSFSRGRGLALNPYLNFSGEGRDDRIIAINHRKDYLEGLIISFPGSDSWYLSKP